MLRWILSFRRRSIVSCALVGAVAFAGAAPLYPAAPRDPRPDHFWGRSVPDPYRWLENVDSAQTQAWVRAEGELTRSYLDAIDARGEIKTAYRRLLDYEKLGAPSTAGRAVIYRRNAGLQNQSVLYVRIGGGPARVLLDPNRLAQDGTVALGATSVTRDGTLMAYATQASGSDWDTWHVRTVATGRDLPDVLHWSKFSSATWVGDRGFYYSAFDKPAAANTTLAALGVQKVYFHRLRTPQSADRLVYADPAHPNLFAGISSTEDERYLLLDTSYLDANGIRWRRRGEADTAFRTLFPLDGRSTYRVIGDDGNRLYVLTNKNAPRWRLSYVDVRAPGHRLHDIVAQRADRLTDVSLIGNRFYCNYLHDAHSLIAIHALDGHALGTIALPGIGSASPLDAQRTDRTAYYSFESFINPSTIYGYDTVTGRSTIWARPHIAFNSADYVTDLDFAPSRDGTRVPVFVTHRRDMPLDGTTPTILYGYGGFDISLPPEFSSGNALWLQMGGAYAQAILRGGGEYGEAWHDAGRLAHKQHVFDDFIGAARMLIARRITSTPKLAIHGESNGGLLVGATLLQRPDLFGAAIPEVGVMDMLRYQTWTVGKAWIPEYGDARASRAAFDWLIRYSPDDNVRPAHYPPTLIMTSDHDDRVFPAHSLKFAAAMQHAQQGDAPVLLRVESKGGHGGGRPLSKIIDDEADRYAFLVRALHMTPAAVRTR